MKRLVGLVVAIVFSAAIVAGCDGTSEVDNRTTPNNATPITKPSAFKENDREAENWPRTYIDALGRKIVLEKKPEKVALLFFRNFEHLFLLEESPIAATELDVLDQWASLAPYKSKYDIADIGSIGSPNVEKLLEIEPDLIIMFSGGYEKHGEVMEKIAPVITVDSNENNWQGALREYRKIFGKEQKAEIEIALIEALIADSREQLEKYSNKTFWVIMLGDKQHWAFTTQFIFNKDNGLGLNPPSNYVDMSTKGEQISLEGLAAMNLDYMFVADIGGSFDTLKKHLENLESNSVWNSLGAIKTDIWLLY